MSRKLNYKDQALPLVIFNPGSQKYEINDEALEYIQSIPGPIAVVGVAGLYRTGKSYLLNQMLLNRSDGFGVGPTVNPCTKGIWIWGRPLLGQNQDGDSVNILIIDSEGIGALDENSTHDSRIFALTVLLSSCFIYNSVGSIDESAIENLSLIVNLTKNIQVKAKQGSQQKYTSSEDEDEDIDYEDYASILPSFLWVVRDFSLQLVDENGDQVTQQEYLERALMQQKGFSESIEQKNRVRRCLTNFFKDRQCYTLVRPLTNEENLQNLDKMSFDQLRPEFFQQVITMRKKILNNVKEKKIQNQSLTGNMYSDLIQSYLTAINGGAVPNIENAWTYICQNECHKALEIGYENYEQVVRELMHNKLPMSLEDLTEYHQLAKHQALQSFQKKAIQQSEFTVDFEKDLRQKIKQKFQILKIENEKESHRVQENFIQIEFQAIERKLKLNEYGTNIQEFQNDINLFKEYFLENGPKSVNKKIFILNFMNNVLQEASAYFIKNIQNQTELDITLLQEKNKKLEAEIQDIKEYFEREKKMNQEKINQLVKDKQDLEVKDLLTQERISEIRLENQRLEQELKESQQNHKSENQKIIQQIKEENSVLNEKYKEMERKLILQQSEFDKERALQEQKIQYYEKQQEELYQKEFTQSNDIKNLKKELQKQVKEETQKFDLQNKENQLIISNLNDKISELESENLLKEQEGDLEKRKLEIQTENLKRFIEEQEQKLENTEKELRVLKEASKNQENLGNRNKEISILQQQIQEYQNQIKNKDDSLSSVKAKLEKDKAVLQQKIEFLELQNSENLQQLEENKKAHEAIMKAFETQQNDRLDGQLTEELKQQHNFEIQQLQKQFEQSKQRLVEQNEALIQKLNDYELKQRYQTVDHNKRIEDLEEQLNQTTIENDNLFESNKNLEQQLRSLEQSIDEKYIKRIEFLEEQNDEIKKQLSNENKELQDKNEQSYAQLKNLYEMERNQLEQRIQDERDKYQKKMQQQSEEFFEQKRQDQAQYDEELENVKQDLREQEQNYHQVVSQYDHELNLKQQTIETLEKHIKETKENLASLQSQNSSSLEQYINNFAQERKQYLEKLENLSNEVQKKEKEIISLTQKKEYLDSHIAKKDSIIQQQKEQLTTEKNEAQELVEKYKKQIQNVNDQFLEFKIESSKDIALSNQKNEFLTKKNEDLQRQNDIQAQRLEEKLSQLKLEHTKELQEKLEKIENEKNSIETKYQKAKQTLKEIEGTYNKQLSHLEREKASQLEKIQNLDKKLQEFESKYNYEIIQLKSQNKELKDNQNFERKQHKQEIERYKTQIFDLEQEKNDQIMNYDRDSALWEGKFQFLEQQKEQAKQDLNDALKKFEITLQHLQKARSNEKDNHDSTLNELLVSMEKKYQSQISEITEQNQKIVQDYEDKLRKQQKELKQLKEQQYIQKFGSPGQNVLNEKKIQEFMNNERKLQQEIQQIKQDRDQRIQIFQNQYEKEKENYRQKIQDLEQKLREYDQKKQQMLFDFEKEKAKWNIDKDHLIVQKNELLDNLEKLEKKREIILRENEKLRNDNKVSRRSINLLGQGLSSNSILNRNKSPNTSDNKQLRDISNKYQSSYQQGLVQYDMYNNSQYSTKNNYKNNSILD